MARARLLKPEFFVHEELGLLEPLARLLFAGLWTLADREGRLEDRPARIKIQVLPWDNCDVDGLLGKLYSVGSITRYEVEGKRFIEIPSFLTYQKPHQRELVSTIPPSSKGEKQRLGRAQAQPRRPVSKTVTDPVTVTVTDQNIAGVKPPAVNVAAEVLGRLAEETGQPPVWGPGDYSVVNKALKSFSRDQLFQAILGIKHDPWPERKLNLGPGKIFGSHDAVKKFIRLATDGPPKPKVDVRRGLQRAEDQGWDNVPFVEVPK